MQKSDPPYDLLRTGRWLPVIFCCLLCACVQRYVSPYKSPPTRYLVVEGYISGNTVTQYTLTRTIGLPGDSTIPTVTGATVQVEGSDRSVYPLAGQGNGVYGSDTLPLNAAVQYRLRINTGSESHLSDFAPFRPTPAIDSVNWIYGSNGVSIYVNTHDPTNSTRYYQWTYDQTWEYYSAEQSYFIYQPATNTVVPRTTAQMDYRCWKNSTPANLLIGSSAKLSQDEIYRYPLVQIPPNGQQLSVLYSILVTQYALTDSGYNFLSLMQQNTESLGSVFDVQPSQLIGNIHCLNNPNEPVIGYISAGTVQQQRIYISPDQVPGWDYIFECEDLDVKIPDLPDSLRFYFGSGMYTPLQAEFGFYYANRSGCVDCTALGGTTVKPAFWPN